MGLLLAAALAGLPALAPRSGWKLATVLSLMALPFTLWWCGYASLSGQGPDSVAAVAAVTTNTEEAFGALRLAMTRAQFVAVSLAHVLFLALACWSALRISIQPTPGRVRAISAALLACLLPVAIIFVRESGKPDWPHLLMGTNTFTSPLSSAMQLLSEASYIRRMSSPPENQRPDAHALRSNSRPILAILYVGESARSDGYGPQHRTRGSASGWLAARIEEGLGAWLPTTCASSDGTSLSLPLLLTASPPERFDAAARLPTVLGLLKAEGFSTAWLSNNEAGARAREGGHDLYQGRFTADPRQAIGFSSQDWHYDGEMAPAAQRFASSHAGAVAMILHSMGSHARYKDRYPADFFPPEPAGLDSNAQMELQYARSLEYGAEVIFHTAAAVLDSTSRPAFLVYTSDHGENLPGDNNGFQTHVAPRTTTEDGFVPSFVLWNQTMAETGRPQRIVSRLRAAKIIAHADVARAFLELAGTSEQPVEPTPDPKIWGRINLRDPYGSVRCALLKP